MLLFKSVSTPTPVAHFFSVISLLPFFGCVREYGVSFFVAYFYPAIERHVLLPRVRKAKLFCLWVLSELRPLRRLFSIRRQQIHLLFSLANKPKWRRARTIYYFTSTAIIIYCELYSSVDMCACTNTLEAVTQFGTQQLRHNKLIL